MASTVRETPSSSASSAPSAATAAPARTTADSPAKTGSGEPRPATFTTPTSGASEAARGPGPSVRSAAGPGHDRFRRTRARHVRHGDEGRGGGGKGPRPERAQRGHRDQGVDDQRDAEGDADGARDRPGRVADLLAQRGDPGIPGAREEQQPGPL